MGPGAPPGPNVEHTLPAHDDEDAHVCGFAGELRLDGGAPDREAVARMSATMADRGPDASGVRVDGPLALGHRRLKIIDLSDAGGQPMHDPDLDCTIVFNGCIYNHHQLRDELSSAGFAFFSTSDTEVILKAYRAWGDELVHRLQGMFAFVLRDNATGRVLLARDRFGIKPLYLEERRGALRFASTLPGLLAGGGVDTAIDPVALHHYLTFHSVVPAPHTILRGVRKLAPATTLAIEPDGHRTQRTYWEPDFTRHPDDEELTEADWEQAVLDRLRQAVQWRLVADVPVGVLLSGGVDSSLVVGLLAEAGQRGLKTFSIGFESVGDVAGDEFAYSDLVAERFATDHTRIRIPTERIPDALGRAVHAMSEPMVSHDAVAFHLLSEEVARHVKVVQSGQGADEVFAGYHWYPAMAKVQEELDALPSDASLDLAVDTYAAAFFDRSHADMAEVVSPEHRVDRDVSRQFVRDHFASSGAATGVDKALRLDATIMLVDDPVKRVDNMTMAHGLEARVPFLDHEVLELAGRIPPELKLAHDGKGVLKQAARRVIPSEVIDRPKGYFPVPALTYLRGTTLDYVRDALTAPAARDRGLFQDAYVQELLADPNAELTPLRGNKLWQLGLLELWLQTHGV